MNYISEINSFYDWLIFNCLPADAQVLWHVLLYINNKCAININDKWYWRVEFTVPNSTLISLAGFSQSQLDRMRKVLIKSGRIIYIKGKRNQCGKYKIIPFDNSMTESYVDNFPDKVWDNF